MKSVIQKRILPVLLVVALLTSFMVFPVSASSLDDGTGWYDVLDYAYCNGNSNRFEFKGSKTVTFDLPEKGKLYYIDFIVTCDGELNASVIYRNSKVFTLNKVFIGNGMYRYWGYINKPYYESLVIRFDGTEGVSYKCDFHTCKVYTLAIDSFADIGQLMYVSGQNVIIKEMSSSSSSANIRVSNSEDHSTFYNLFLDCNNWVKYDYIDFSFELKALSVSSITASQSGTALDVDYTLIDGGVDEITQSNKYYVHLRLDLTGVDRSSVSVPRISISGAKGIVLDSTLSRVTGHIKVNSINPLLYFFTHLENSINDCFSALHIKLDSIYQGLLTSLTGIKDSINTRFNDLKGWLESGFKSVVDKLDELVNGSTEQQAAADQFNESVNSQSGQIDQAVNDMNVARPDPGSINTSVGAITGNLDFTPLNTCVQSLVSSNTVYQCLIMAVTLMLVSYLLFGKKV